MKKLIYFSDPMCSWCYGLKPELERVISHFKDDLDLEIIMGGLRPGGGDPWTDEFKGKLKRHWDHVQLASGQPFCFKLLQEENYNYNTEPACRAVCIIKKIQPAVTFEFLNKVQHMFYAEGEDPTREAFYKPILNALNVDQTQFLDLFRSSEGYMLSEMDFHQTARYRVTGFPTLLLEMTDAIYPISYGYSSFKMMRDRINAFILQN